MGDLLGEDFALVQGNKLYRCLDKLLAHTKALSGYLQGRWKELFGAHFEVLLYDLTSTYFESDCPLRKYASTAIAATNALTVCRSL